MSTADTAETTALIALLREHYRATSVPAPNSALTARMEAGVAPDEVMNESPVDELAARRRGRALAGRLRDGARTRTRYAVAALAAAFVATSGLAAAGALPAAVQREVSSDVSHLGVGLPSPVAHPAASPGPDAPSVVHTNTPAADTEPAPRSTVPSTAASPAQGTATSPTALPGSGLPTVPVGGAPPPIAVPAVAVPDVPPVAGLGTPPLPATTLP